MKFILLVLGFALGVFAFAIALFWYAGNHGKIMFRVNMLEDWVMSIAILFSIIGSILSFKKGIKLR